MSALASDFIAGIQLFVLKQIRVVLVLGSIFECESFFKNHNLQWFYFPILLLLSI